MTFQRAAEIPLGHKFYTSAKTLASWGSGGIRALQAANDNFDSRGNNCKLLVPSDWLSAVSMNSRPIVRPLKEFTFGRKKPTWLPRIALGRGEHVPLPNDGPTAEWRAERDAAGFAVDYGSEGNRIERALVKEKSPLVATLRQVTELMRPPVVAANDNEPSNDEGQPGNSGKAHERVHNQGCITPSVPMLLRAYQAGMASGVRELDKGWHRIGPTDGKRKLTGLIFLNGELIAYGDDKGRKRRPDYKANRASEAVIDDESETAKHIAAQPEENRSYIRLAGRERYISSQRPDAPGSIAPPPRTARAIANDNELAKAAANTPVMPAVKKLPDGPAKDYGRLAGIAETIGTGEGKTSAPMHDVLSEMERAEQLGSAGFDADDLAVIDAIITDASFRTIGLARGYAESSAHRMGRKVVEDILTRLSEKIAA